MVGRSCSRTARACRPPARRQLCPRSVDGIEQPLLNHRVARQRAIRVERGHPVVEDELIGAGTCAPSPPAAHNVARRVQAESGLPQDFNRANANPLKGCSLGPPRGRNVSRGIREDGRTQHHARVDVHHLLDLARQLGGDGSVRYGRGFVYQQLHGDDGVVLKPTRRVNLNHHTPVRQANAVRDGQHEGCGVEAAQRVGVVGRRVTLVAQ
jgi:hypothetical protein